MWASSPNYKFSWSDWCKSENYYQNDFNKYFEFELKENSKIISIKKIDDIKNLPIQNKFIDIIFLDFEKIKNNYDVIEVIMSDRQVYNSLYGWDCDSILVLNKDVINIKKEP